MTAEWLAAVTAVIAAFVAGGASIFAYSQAISARRQADSSEQAAKATIEQARIARDAANSAEAQVRHLDRTAASSVVALATKAKRQINRCDQVVLELELAGLAEASSQLTGSKAKALADLGDELEELAPLFEQNVMAQLQHYVKMLQAANMRLALGTRDDNLFANLSHAKTQATAALDLLIEKERRQAHS